MRSEDVPEIRGLPLFRTMAPASFETLFRGAYLQTFPPQVQLIGEGDASDFLHVLTEGAVELFASWNRRETTMAVLVPVASFILAATISDRPYLMSARTMEKSRIALIPGEDVRRAFSDDREFATAIVMELAGGFRSATRHAKDLKLRSSVERLANYLARIDAQTGSNRNVRSPNRKAPARVAARHDPGEPLASLRGTATLRRDGECGACDHRQAEMNFARSRNRHR